MKYDFTIPCDCGRDLSYTGSLNHARSCRLYNQAIAKYLVEHFKGNAKDATALLNEWVLAGYKLGLPEIRELVNLQATLKGKKRYTLMDLLTKTMVKCKGKSGVGPGWRRILYWDTYDVDTISNSRRHMYYTYWSDLDAEKKNDEDLFF